MNYSNKKKVLINKRQEKLARMNTSLNSTIKNIAKKYSSKSFKPDYMMIVNVVCPFLNTSSFEAAINLIKIFETDEVIAVKKENDNFFVHNGKSLKSIHKNINLSLERNEVLREIGGLRLIKIDKIGNNHNTIGHIFLDEKSSFIIKTEQDLKIAKYITMNNIY